MRKFLLIGALACASVASAQIVGTTPRLSLQLPQYGSSNWHVPVNYNWQLLDKIILTPPPGQGIVFYDTSAKTSRAATSSDIKSILGKASATQDGYLSKEDFATFAAGGGGGGGGGLASPGSASLVYYTGTGFSTAPATSGNVISTLSDKLNANSGILQLDSGGHIAAAQTGALTGDVTKSAGSATTAVATVGGQSASAVANAASAWANANSANNALKLDANALIPAPRMPALTGDVTTSAGAVAATVVTVGGQTASSVAAAAAGWSNANTANGAAKLNGSGVLPTTILPAFTGDVTSSAGSASLTLSNSGVTAGTYPKVTVDAKGRVTGGASLSAGDIPSIPYSKISDPPPSSLPADAAGFLHNDGSGNLSYTAGTGADPTTINYTPTSVTSPNTVTAQKKLDQTLTLGIDAGDCDTPGFDNTTALTHLSARATTIRLQPGKTCSVHNPTITDHTSIIGGAGAVLKNYGSDTTAPMLQAKFLNDFKLQDVTLDLNGANFSGAGANNAALYIQQSNGVVIDHVNVINSGTQNTSTAGIVIFNAEVTVRNPNVSIQGPGIVNDFAYNATNAFRVEGGHIDGSQANAVVLHNTGGTTAFCNAEITGLSITNQGDAFIGSGDQGENGNAFDIDRCNGVRIHHTSSQSVEFSCYRIFNGRSNMIDHNTCDGAREAAAYAEFGAIYNTFDSNIFTNFFGGINDTNVANRNPDGWNYIKNNRFIGGAERAISCEECFATGNTIEKAPYGIQVGHGSQTHMSIVTNNTCRDVDMCIVGDTSVGGAQEISGNRSLGTVTIGHLFPYATPNGVSVTGVDFGTTTTIHYTGTPSITSGMRVCFSSFNASGPYQLNSQCPTVSTATTSQFTVPINSTGYTAWTAPTGGRVNGWVTTAYSSGTTPAYTFTNSTRVTNETLPLNLLGSLADGSEVWVPNADPTSSSCIAGSGGARAYRVNGVWICRGTSGGGGGASAGGAPNSVEYNCAGIFCGDATNFSIDPATWQLTAKGGFKSGGTGTGQIAFGDATSGFAATLKPISGLSQNYTLNIPSAVAGSNSAIAQTNLGTPSVSSWGSGAGSSNPSSPTINGTNSHFLLSFTATSSPATGNIVVINFSSPWNSAPQCRATSQGRPITGVDASNSSTNSVTISDTSAISASQAYKIAVDCY